MTTTTYIFPTSKQPSTLLRNYGSMGRYPTGRRKSAVELLQETKAFYVKSESVLDTKQNLKNTEHLHVRSPTVDVQLHRLGTAADGDTPFFPIGNCPPYAHHHFDPYDHVPLTEREFETFVQQQLINNEDGRVSSYFTITESNTLPLERNNKISRSISNNTVVTGRSGLPSSGHNNHHHIYHYHNAYNARDKKDAGMNNVFGLPPLPFPPSGGGQRLSATLPHPPHRTSSSSAPPTNPSVSSALPPHGDIPPALPPKSPRTTSTANTSISSSKPLRPQGFPQKLPVQTIAPPDLIPPLPRRQSDHQRSDHFHEGNVHSKLRRLYDGGAGNGNVNGMGGGDQGLVPMTLPSPILPPTPPPESTSMESPMSESGNFPIISPPPAFSTPVTPILVNRQNSSASEKSVQKVPNQQHQQQQQQQQHHPISQAMSMAPVPVPPMRSQSSRKSIPDLSDISIRYSPQSNSNPTSPDDPDGADADDDDDDSSTTKAPTIAKTSKHSQTDFSLRCNQAKPFVLPKSVTENALCKFSGNGESATRPRISSHSNEVSPLRKPILRSKSDLSHRYLKSRSSSNLLSGGFTLVHIPSHITDLPMPETQHTVHIKPYNFHPMHKQAQQQKHQSEEVLLINGSTVHDKKRDSKSSIELEHFFNKLGMENNTPPPTAPISRRKSGGDRSDDSSPVFFSSVSSVDSGARRFGSIDSGDSPLGVKIGSRTVGHCTSTKANIVVQHGEPSIVERNARVIKWLFNCRKSQDEKR